MIALLAPDRCDHIAWRLALRHMAADVRSLHFPLPEPLPQVDRWVVVLHGNAELLARPAWAAQLNARTLLVIDATEPAVRLASLIPHPVLLSNRDTARLQLREQLALLGAMTAGRAHYGTYLSAPAQLRRSEHCRG